VSLAYVAAPVLGYVCAGAVKWLRHSLLTREFALRPRGSGGFPSTHAATASAPLFLIALRDGWSDPAAGVAVALLLIVVVDSLDLRRQVGEQATVINRLEQAAGGEVRLRERIGHTAIESAGGVALGFLVGAVLALLS